MRRAKFLGLLTAALMLSGASVHAAGAALARAEGKS